MTEFSPISPRSIVSERPEPWIAEARVAAQKLEATFLAEMLKAAGFGTQRNEFSGGSGEDQFASFHREAISDRIAAGGGLGLAEQFVRFMMEAENDR